MKKNKDDKKSFSQVTSISEAREKSVSEKADALRGSLQQIEKQFGKGSIMKLGDRKVEDFPHIPSGILSLDYALGIGGFPKGRIIEIFGPESVGKTSLCLNIVSQSQKAGGVCSYIDVEHALDPIFAKKIGVNIDDLLVSQPNSGEEALEITESLVRSNAVDVVVVDSVAALVPKSELEGNMGDSVSHDTPVLIRDRYSREIDVVSISSLFKGQQNFPYSNRHTYIYRKTKEIEVFTSSGWKKLLGVCKKRNNKEKPIFMVNTAAGLAMCTADHSLFSESKEEISLRELKIGDKLSICYPDMAEHLTFINKDIAWLLGYFCAEGSILTKESNTCKLGDTKMDFISKSANIAKQYFQCHIHFHTHTYSEENGRKPLHSMTISRSPHLIELLKSCIDWKTKEKKVPPVILNSNKQIIEHFLDGYRDGDGDSSVQKLSFSTSSFPMLAGVSLLFRKIGKRYRISAQYRKHRITSKPEFTLTESDNPLYPDGEIKRIIEIDVPEFLYDIETEDGTFAGGAGFITHHNSQMGVQARLMSQAMRKLTASISKSKTLVIFVNQIRQKIGVMYGSPDVTTGGNALKFYASVRLDIRRIEQLKRGEEIIGNRIKVKVIKNKVAPPFRQAEYNFFFDTGFDYSGSILETATDAGVVERTGTWYAYKGERLGQGKENATQNLASRTELMEEIKQATLIKLKEDRDASVAQKKLEDGKTLSVDKSTGEIIED